MNYHKQRIFSLEFKNVPEYEPDDTILYQTMTDNRYITDITDTKDIKDIKDIKDTKDIKNGINK